ncbi:MAG TPA: nuclear transport factor 2 family protein [Streptomyces sp.]
MTTPRDVFAALADGISEGRFAELSALYAENTVVEHPQAVPRPTRIEGRDVVHERFTGALAGAYRFKRKNVVVHETTDPEVIVAEYDYDAESVETGRTTTTANVQVLRVRDGLIVHSRDYHDYLRLAVIRDGVDVPPLCNFIRPAIVRTGPLAIAISTAGASPALAKRMKREIADTYGEPYARLAVVLNDVRGWAKATLPTYQDRKEFFEGIVNGDPDPVELIRAGREDEVRDLVEAAKDAHAAPAAG